MAPRRALGEWQFWAGFAALLALYVVRWDGLPLVGEETRVARVAVEMTDRGDFVVPRELGEPFPSRPPILFWLVAGAGQLAGEIDLFAVRAASLCAVVLTGLLIYLFGRTWLSANGGLLAVLFWATFLELLVANRKAEAEALFTLAISLCLFGWHAAYWRGWPPAVLWLLGYALAAVATLVKGPQAPVYFAGTTWLFLVWRRDWRTLVHPGQLLGMAAFAGVVALWMVPYCRAEGLDAAMLLWSNDSAARFRGQGVADYLRHAIVFPLEVAGCTLPWSPILLGAFGRRFRAAPDTASGHRAFLLIALGVGFLPCWLTAGGLTCYFQPLYPALALVLAGVACRVAGSGAVPAWWRLHWRTVASATALACLALVGLAVANMLGVTAGLERLRSWTQPAGVTAGLVASGFFAAVMAWRAGSEPGRAGRGALALAAFLAGLGATAWIDSARTRFVPLGEEVAALKAELPTGQPAYRVGYVHHRFAYYNRRQLEPVEMAGLVGLRPGDCVCLNSRPGAELALPVDYRVEGVLSMDRLKSAVPSQVVVVCRVVNPGSPDAVPAHRPRVVGYPAGPRANLGDR